MNMDRSDFLRIYEAAAEYTAAYIRSYPGTDAQTVQAIYTSHEAYLIKEQLAGRITS